MLLITFAAFLHKNFTDQPLTAQVDTTFSIFNIKYVQTGFLDLCFS